MGDLTWSTYGLRMAVARWCADNGWTEYQLSVSMGKPELEVADYLAGHNRTLRMYRAAERFCQIKGIERAKEDSMSPNGTHDKDAGIAKPGDQSAIITNIVTKQKEDPAKIVAIGKPGPFPDGFIVVRPRPSRFWAITVSSTKDMTLSSTFYEALGSPEHVSMAVNADKNVFAIRVVPNTDPNAVSIRKSRRISREISTYMDRLPRGRYKVLKHKDHDCYIAYLPEKEGTTHDTAI